MSIKSFFSTYYAFGVGSAAGIALVFGLDIMLAGGPTGPSVDSILVALFIAAVALAFTIPAGILLAKQNIPENKLILRLAISAVLGALAGWLLVTMFIEVLSNGNRSASNIGIYLACSAIAHLIMYIIVKVKRSGKK